MGSMKLQLNTPVEITRDLQVEVVDQISGRSIATTPFLDGTVNVRSLDPGSYRVMVRHPNLPFAVLDRAADAGQILVDDSAGAEVHVADFRVAHLAVGQADVAPGTRDQGVRAIGPETVPRRGVGGGNGVGFADFAVAESVEHHEQGDFLHRLCRSPEEARV